MNSLLRLNSLVLIFAVISCKIPNSISHELKHEFGNTTYPARPELMACKQPQTDEVSQYLKDIAFHIMQRNSHVFKDAFDPGEFCFRWEKEREFNASASPYDGTIIFNSALILAAKNDAEIAAVMAHELAHITMYHKEGREHPKLIGSQKWLEDKVRLSKIDARIKNRELLYNEYRAGIYSSWEKSLPADLVEARKKVFLQLKPYTFPESLKLKNLLPHSKATDVFSIADSSDMISYKLSFNGLKDRFSGEQHNDNYPDTLRNLVKKLALPDQEAVKPYINELLYLNEQAEKLAVRLIDAIDPKFFQNLIPFADYLQEDFAERDSILSYRRTFVSDEEYANWMEEEADDVGLEFFVRAGFGIKSFGWIDHRACDKSIEELSSTPDRGTSSHPNSCWRLYDSQITEAKDHEKEYGELTKNPPIVHLFPGKLSDVKDLLNKQ